MKSGARNHSAGARRRAQKMRREMNVSEQMLWSWIRQRKLGFLFKRQVPVGPYILDFYCPEASLAIEVDGPFHEHRTASDAARDEWLHGQGIEVLRIPSLDLFHDQGIAQTRWLNVITQRCEVRTGRQSWEPRKPRKNPPPNDAPRSPFD